MYPEGARRLLASEVVVLVVVAVADMLSFLRPGRDVGEVVKLPFCDGETGEDGAGVLVAEDRVVGEGGSGNSRG
jgi:hypothetical protein